MSCTLLNILADLSNAVVWMVSTRPLISKSSSPRINPLVTVPSAPVTTGVIHIPMFHIIIIIIIHSEFFTPVLSDGLSLEFGGQQVS